MFCSLNAVQYGAPGCGKSSTIQRIAGELGLDVYIVTLSRSGLDDNALYELIGRLPKRCIALMEDIDAAKELIASAPLLYPVSQYATVGKGSYREKIVRSYVLVYRVREEDETVVLARMFHQRENYMRQVAEWD